MSGAAASGALVMVACGSDKRRPRPPHYRRRWHRPTAAGDAKVAALAASLEVLAVSTYTSALAAAQADTLGAVPEAVATYATRR